MPSRSLHFSFTPTGTRNALTPPITLVNRLPLHHVLAANFNLGRRTVSGSRTCVSRKLSENVRPLAERLIDLDCALDRHLRLDPPVPPTRHTSDLSQDRSRRAFIRESLDCSFPYPRPLISSLVQQHQQHRQRPPHLQQRRQQGRREMWKWCWWGKVGARRHCGT